jgi:hypothetical protein
MQDSKAAKSKKCWQGRYRLLDGRIPVGDVMVWDGPPVRVQNHRRWRVRLITLALQPAKRQKTSGARRVEKLRARAPFKCLGCSERFHSIKSHCSGSLGGCAQGRYKEIDEKGKWGSEQQMS